MSQQGRDSESFLISEASYHHQQVIGDDRPSSMPD